MQKLQSLLFNKNNPTLGFMVVQALGTKINTLKSYNEIIHMFFHWELYRS